MKRLLLLFGILISFACFMAYIGGASPYAAPIVRKPNTNTPRQQANIDEGSKEVLAALLKLQEPMKQCLSMQYELPGSTGERRRALVSVMPDCTKLQKQADVLEATLHASNP